MHILTIRQPWPWAILRAGKDVENRKQYTSVRGRVAIQAAMRIDRAGYELLYAAEYDVPEDLPLGYIVGVVTITDCVRDSASEWAWPDRWHWTLAGPSELAVPIPHRGRQGLHEAPYDL